MVKLILPKKPIVSSQYELYLTSEKQLLEELNKELESFERKEKTLKNLKL